MKFIYFILTTILFVSCNIDTNILTEIRDVDYLNKTADVIEGKNVLDVMGAKGLVVYDTLIMVTTNNPNGQLQVYSVNSYNHLGSFCQKGRAGNEIIDISTVTEQAFNRDGHIIQIVFDRPNTMHEIDITASIDKQNTIVSDSRECLPIRGNEVVILGTDYSNRFEFERNIYNENVLDKVPSRYTLYHNNKPKTLRFFRKPMYVEKPEEYELPYQGSLYKHPTKNIVVQSFASMNYLLYMDFDSKKYFAIHQEESLSFNDNFVSNMPMPLHFSDGAVSNDYIMFLYRQGDYTQKTTKGEWIPEVLIFDWDGKYINGFKLDRFIHYIEYDEKHKVLYGLNDLEQLYAYDLSGLLP